MTADVTDSYQVGDEAMEAVQAIDLPHGNPARRARVRATSVTPARPVASLPARESDTTSSVQDRAQALADGWAARLKAALSDAPPLAQARPPSLALAVADIRARAARHDGLLLKGATWAWGCLYLMLMFAVYAVLFTVRTPSGAAIGAAAGWIIWTCL